MAYFISARRFILLCVVLLQSLQIAQQQSCRAKKDNQFRACVFPFKLQNKIYNGCTTDHDTNKPPQAWCSTLTNGSPDHQHQKGNWGYCTTSCPGHRDGFSSSSTHFSSGFPTLKGEVEDVCGKNDDDINNKDFVNSPDPDRFKFPAGNWPWMVSIQAIQNGIASHWCGGTLITRQHVLTAAHCTYETNLRLRFADKNLNDESDDFLKLERRVSNVTRHPKYRPGMSYYDVAVLTVAGQPLDLHIFLRPVCLPRSPITNPNQYAGHFGTLTGWGKTQRSQKDGGILRRANLNMYSQGYCNQKYGYFKTRDIEDKIKELVPRKFESNIMCAGFQVMGPGSCKGDSGGPLVKFDDSTEKYEQVGIVQGGVSECGDEDYPGVFVRVGDREILNFIQRSIGKTPTTPRTTRRPTTTRTTRRPTTRSSTRRPSNNGLDFGSKTLPDNSTYEGQIRNGMANGFGKATCPCGSVYDGNFVNDVRSGHGKIVWSDGTSYVGEWKNNLRHGTGNMTYSDSWYYGSWRDNYRNGWGTFFITSGDFEGYSYIGPYLNDVKHGTGTWKTPDGYEFTGEFDNNMPVFGEVKRVDPSGNVKTVYAIPNSSDGTWNYADRESYNQGGRTDIASWEDFIKLANLTAQLEGLAKQLQDCTNCG